MRELGPIALATMLAASSCADPLTPPPARTSTESLPHARLGGIGHVETERPTIRVSSSVPGLIERVHVERGDRVEAGQALVSFASSTEQADIHAAEAELAEATAALAQVRRGHEAFEVDEATARAAAARTQAELARREADRATILHGRGAVSSATSEGAVLTARQAEEAAAAAEAHRTGIAGGSRFEAIAQARARLELARAAVERAHVARGHRDVTATRAGTVLEVFAHEGEYFQPGSADGLVLLADIAALRVRVVLDERTVGQVHVGQAASVYTDAAPETEIPGEVVEIAPQVRTEGAEPGLEIWVSVSADRPMLPGQRVTVLLMPGTDA